MNFMAPGAWRGQFGGDDGRTWPDGRFHIDFVRALERAKFDYMMIEDSSMVPDAYGGSTEVELIHSLYAPKHDPIPLVPLLAAATERIGIVATMSTSFYPPFMLARTMATLDHLTRGRVGWNIVTSSEHRAAQNYGMDRLTEHDERYDRADEFVELVERLWEAWEPDALVMERDSGRYVDHSKVHSVDFEGRWYRSRGPLNTLPLPQGRPVYCQAGGSPRGREFAARHAETIIASARGVPAMQAYRDDVRRQAEKFGRDPDSIKVLFVVSPVLAETDTDAVRVAKLLARPTDWKARSALAHLSALTENDFSTYDLDAPPPTLTTNGHRSTLTDFLHSGSEGATLREMASAWSISSVDLIGCPDTVAERMGEVMEEVGGDGFLITGLVSRAYINQITDGLAPALQRRGLTRTSYEHEHFRDNLLAF